MPAKTKTILLFVAGSLVLVVLAGAAALLLGDYDSERLGEAVLGRLGPVLGMDLQAEGFRMRPLRGLEIQGLRGRGSLPVGELELSARRLVLDHSLLSLLTGTLEVHRILVEEPVVELTSGGAGGTALPAPGPGAGAGEEPRSAAAAVEGSRSSDLRLRVDEIRLENAVLVAHPASAAAGATGPPASSVEVRGLDLVLDDVSFAPGAASPLAGWRARGEASFERALLGATEVTDGEGGLSLDGGHFRVPELRIRLDQGPARLADLDVDLTTEPFAYDLSLTGEPLDTNRFVLPEDAASPEDGFGPSRLELTLVGRGADPATLDGGGALAVEPGSVPALPLFRVIDTLLSGVRLAGSPYEPFEVRYRVEGPRVLFEPTRLSTETLVLTLESGWAELGGLLDLRMTLRAPRALFEGVEEIPRELLEALADEDERVVLPFQVAGTLEAPRLAVDRSGVGERLREGLEREVGRRLRDEIGKGLRSLLGEEEEEGEEEPP